MLQLYNTQIINKIKVFSVLLLLFSSCSLINKEDEKKTESQSKIIKKKRIDNNVINRADQNATRGLTLFGKRKGKDELGNSNIMWKATLDTLDAFPISYASFSGAIIGTDWYSNNESNESIKIEIRFLANEISPRSIKVTSFKKRCINTDCKV